MYTLRITRLLAVSICVLGASNSALAQEAMPDSGVSTLNGQLVPVGEANRYLHRYERFNLSTNPIGLMLGSYGVAGSYALNGNIALRADFNYGSPFGTEGENAFEVGLSTPLYFRKMYSGLFLEPGVVARRLERGPSDASNTLVGPQVLMGWHWLWDSGFNVAAAVGAGRDLYTRDDDEYADELFANGYLRVGYAF